MPTYEESENGVTLSSHGNLNLKCMDHQSSKSSETPIPHEAMEGSPDRKAYVRIINSEYGKNEGSAASPIGVSVSPHENSLQEHELADMQNLSLEDGSLKEKLNNVEQRSNQNISPDSSSQLSSKAGNDSLRSNHTVSQPFALATEKRACSSEQKQLSKLNHVESPKLVKKTQV